MGAVRADLESCVVDMGGELKGVPHARCRLSSKRNQRGYDRINKKGRKAPGRPSMSRGVEEQPVARLGRFRAKSKPGAVEPA